jgi:integrase
LLDQLRERIRLRHYSIRTERAYVDWARRFILFHGKRHPISLGAAEVETFLTSLAVDRNVSASTQNQALSALLFLYRDVLNVDLPWLDGITRAKKPQRLPTVLTRREVQRVLAQMDDTPALVCRLLYGTGMRLMEAVRLRIKDIDFEKRMITVRDGKGAKDRVTVLPDAVLEPPHAAP